MSLYNLLFGMNSKTPLILAAIGLREHEVERFRDCGFSEDGSQVQIYTRTGGGNRTDYPQEKMRSLPGWRHSNDDDFDCTYCTDYFDVPEEWREDLAHLNNMIQHGVRAEFMQHLAKTLQREPTEADQQACAYDEERAALNETRHLMANGHTFVPLDDSAMLVALRLAEANGGELLSCWGVAPIALQINENHQPFPHAKDKDYARRITRAKISYAPGWTMDLEYWQHVIQCWGGEFPKAIAKIQQTVDNYTAKAAMA